MRFEVERIDSVSLDRPDELLARNLMSPFAWIGEGDAGIDVLVRAVPPDRANGQESGRLWFGHAASDGLAFHMDATPTLVPGDVVPGDGPDSHGCEDPTVVRTEQGLVVYYTGVDAETCSHLCYATGSDARSLRKRGVALTSTKSEHNTKEATVARGDGRWRLLYEHAHNGHSLISLTDAPGPAGPWDERPDPFSPRPDQWDSWHLSTGPLLLDDSACPVMFYNGADRGADWGIGWVALSPDLSHVEERCGDALIAPPSDATGARDISFAASVVERDGTIWLYYSCNDRELRRATIRRA